VHPPAAGWSKSSFCAARDCVELARLDDGAVALRNSGDPATMIRYTAAEWQAFVAGVKAGEFDSAS
jgi:hypothetical protein